ncbi:hypothetical protein ACM66B_004289 [Microbotryomycetes sp. NB124-2]
MKEVLELLSPNVREIEFVRVGKMGDHVQDFRELEYAMRTRHFTSIHLNRLRFKRHMHQNEFSTATHRAIRAVPTIEEFAMNDCLDDALLCWRLFDQPAIHIKNLSVRTAEICDTDAGSCPLAQILSKQRNHLQGLCLNRLRKWPGWFDIRDYNSDGSLDPAQLGYIPWAYLTSLTRLELCGFHSLTFEVIESIVSQLYLTRLSCAWSTWALKPQDWFDVIVYGERDGFPALCDHLKALATSAPTLLEYHVGTLPWLEESHFDRSLRRFCEGLNYEVRWQTAVRSGP